MKNFPFFHRLADKIASNNWDKVVPKVPGFEFVLISLNCYKSDGTFVQLNSNPLLHKLPKNDVITVCREARTLKTVLEGKPSKIKLPELSKLIKLIQKVSKYSSLAKFRGITKIVFTSRFQINGQLYGFFHNKTFNIDIAVAEMAEIIKEAKILKKILN